MGTRCEPNADTHNSKRRLVVLSVILQFMIVTLPSGTQAQSADEKSTLFRELWIGQPTVKALAAVKKLGFSNIEPTSYDKDTYTFRCPNKDRSSNIVTIKNGKVDAIQFHPCYFELDGVNLGQLIERLQANYTLRNDGRTEDFVYLRTDYDEQLKIGLNKGLLANQIVELFVAIKKIPKGKF